MATSENFCLRLNEFENDIKTFWKELEAEKDFCDVTLACEDKQIKTHKVIISSCSPVFRNILKLNQNPNPLIYLRRVKYKDLQNLLTFMYQGEVNVAEEDLPSFLEVAEDLQIRGLSERNKECSNSKEEISEISDPSAKRKRTVDNYTNLNEPLTEILETRNDLIHNTSSQSKIAERKKENVQSLVSVNGAKTFICKKCEVQFSSKQDLFQHNVSVHQEVCYSCNQCDYKATRKDYLTKHIESVHQRISIPCDKCDKKFSSKANQWKHNSAVHEGIRYPCEYCDYKATTSGNLQTHKLRQHQNK